MLAQHSFMKTRDNMGAVIKALQRKHGLLAAYLKATDKIDWRALNKPVAIADTAKPVNVDAQSAAPELPETGPFTFRRANLPSSRNART
jgi:hypothetical protein